MERRLIQMSVNREHLKRAVDLLPEEKLDMLSKYLRRLEQLPLHERVSLVPDPAGHLRGLHKKIWQGIDVDQYIRRERESWGV